MRVRRQVPASESPHLANQRLSLHLPLANQKPFNDQAELATYVRNALQARPSRSPWIGKQQTIPMLTLSFANLTL